MDKQTLKRKIRKKDNRTDGSADGWTNEQTDGGTYVPFVLET